ncbi:hypothetical protein BG006_007698 [Podila minutissima]|uniref:Uncharacterized protein n=1 Tax=Podila minutissima TaxID=64525 RepID=A0A9P5SGN9_9FUNG|nr:hypothetical protein BG006_007698 [Podila minutissima]
MRQRYPDFDRELIWYTHENIELIVPSVDAVFYHCALWGKLLKYAHKFLRALVVLVSQSSGSTQPIIAGGLFAARWDIIVKDSKPYINCRKQLIIYDLTLDTYEAIELVVPWVVAVLYTYALWGKPLKFIHRNLRAVALLVIAICWLYATIGDLADLIPNRHDYNTFECRRKECFTVGPARS